MPGKRGRAGDGPELPRRRNRKLTLLRLQVAFEKELKHVLHPGCHRRASRRVFHPIRALLEAREELPELAVGRHGRSAIQP